MPRRASDLDGPVKGRAKLSFPGEVDCAISVQGWTWDGLLGELRSVVREAVREELAARGAPPHGEGADEGSIAPAKLPARGVELPTGEMLSARDLRIGLLIGKIPDAAGLLIDIDTAARLLSVSQRTLYRLIDEGAVPEPVRLSGRLLRWRLGELLEWIEAGCPRTAHRAQQPSRTRPGRPK